MQYAPQLYSGGAAHDAQPGRRRRPRPGDLPARLTAATPTFTGGHQPAGVAVPHPHQHVHQHLPRPAAPPDGDRPRRRRGPLPVPPARRRSRRAAASRSAEDQLFDLFTDDEVKQALEDLPENFRLPVLLADVEGFSYKEIAEMLDIPIGTVMSRLHRGRKAMQKCVVRLCRGPRLHGAQPAATESSAADRRARPDQRPRWPIASRRCESSRRSSTASCPSTTREQSSPTSRAASTASRRSTSRPSSSR